jgi:hypothetical protein
MLDLNEVAYNLYDFTLNAVYKYSPKIMVAPKIKMYKKGYIEPSLKAGSTASSKIVLANGKREDKEYQAGFTGTYIYTPKRLFTFEYVHTKHDSNYADNRFIKDTFSANVILPF